VRTSPRIVRKGITQPAKTRRPSMPWAACIASCRICVTSRAGRAFSYVVDLVGSNRLWKSHTKCERVSAPQSVPVFAKRSPQTVLRHGNLYGFPTASRIYFPCCLEVRLVSAFISHRKPLHAPLAREPSIRQSNG
jgi:hypothetical protein